MPRWVSPCPRAASGGSRGCARAAARGLRRAGGAARWRACPRRSSTWPGSRPRAPAAGAFERLDVDVGAARAEHVAGGGVGELGDRGDVARRHLGDRLLLLAAHDRELVQPLVVHRAAVHQRGVGLHRALQHLEQVHVADVRVDDRLEHERDRRTVARRRAAGPSSAMKCASRSTPIELRRAAAQHREHRRPTRRRRRARARARRSGSSRRRGSAP